MTLAVRVLGEKGAAEPRDLAADAARGRGAGPHPGGRPQVPPARRRPARRRCCATVGSSCRPTRPQTPRHRRTGRRRDRLTARRAPARAATAVAWSTTPVTGRCARRWYAAHRRRGQRPVEAGRRVHAAACAARPAPARRSRRAWRTAAAAPASRAARPPAAVPSAAAPRPRRHAVQRVHRRRSAAAVPRLVRLHRGQRPQPEHAVDGPHAAAWSARPARARRCHPAARTARAARRAGLGFGPSAEPVCRPRRTPRRSAGSRSRFWYAFTGRGRAHPKNPVAGRTASLLCTTRTCAPGVTGLRVRRGRRPHRLAASGSGPGAEPERRPAGDDAGRAQPQPVW